MKAYVIKNKEGKYYKRYFATGYVDFVDNFCFSELYTKKEGADETKDFILRNKYRFNVENLEIVEITIVEGDLENQIRADERRKVCQEIRNFMTQDSCLTKEELIECLESFTAKSIFQLLDQIEGESK